MKYNFTEQTRSLFDMGGYCEDWETGMNNADCLHHILKRVSNSPYNACPLNNFNTHQPEGRTMRKLKPLHCFETESKYLKKTKHYLDKIGYIPNKIDVEFLSKYYKYYN